ncbi:MAG: transporter substrate-binding domain-containing protein [Clostridiales Family XIII bacterium]|jgi:polar amino acid transport system substrate-binding protein|nr:transporter substrate-binding domain-containing protein [Clostridiales Family XIII bacterium]
MKMKLNLKQLRILAILALILAFVPAMAACGPSGNDSASESAESADAAETDSAEDGTVEKTSVLIGTSGSPAPYNWVNEDGSLDGYEPAVIAELGNLLPQYAFEFEITDFGSIFTGIDTGRYQMGSNNLSRTPEREERYFFADENHIYNTLVVAFKKGREDIQSAADLSGKSTVTGSDGVAFQLFLESYNEAHKDAPINITYSDQDWLATFRNIDNGTQDFGVWERAVLQSYEDEFGIDLDFIALDSEDTYGLLNLESYFAFPKTEAGEQLRNDISGAVKTLKDSGKLVELSEEYFGFNMFE